MAADARDLCTIDQLKGWLGGFSSPSGVDVSHDDDLQRLVTAASVWFRTQIGWSLLSAACTDRFKWRYPWQSPPARFRLETPQVTSITTVTVDGNAVTARTVIGGAGYVRDGSMLEIHRIQEYLGCLFDYLGSAHEVEIVYAAGYAAIPDDVRQCVIEVASEMWQRHDRLGQRSRSTPEGGTIVYYADDMLPSIRAVVDTYRLVTL